MSQQTPAPQGGSSLSRRRVVTTAAWSVPAVTVATAAPAFAASANPAIQAGSGTLLPTDQIGIHRQGNVVTGQYSPELRIRATNVGDVPLENIRYTVYLLADISASLGEPVEAATGGWGFVQKRALVAADLGFIADSGLGINVGAGVGVAYEFVYAGPLAPETDVALDFPLSAYSSSALVTITNLLTGLVAMSRVTAEYQGSTSYNGSSISDPALTLPSLVVRAN